MNYLFPKSLWSLIMRSTSSTVNSPLLIFGLKQFNHLNLQLFLHLLSPERVFLKKNQKNEKMSLKTHLKSVLRWYLLGEELDAIFPLHTSQCTSSEECLPQLSMHLFSLLTLSPLSQEQYTQQYYQLQSKVLHHASLSLSS